jgi:predicted transglutaminase-like cysteine proteinase
MEWTGRREGEVFDNEPLARSWLLVGIMAACLLGSGWQRAGAQTLGALPVATRSLTPDGPAKPTRAWAQFCERLPAECKVDLSETETIRLTQAAWDKIVSVNKQVNTAIIAVPDQEHWGVQDRWDYPDDGVGDCEDIQLLKRKLLAEKGLPRRAMRMTVVVDREGAGHAVLMVRTSRGDFILDNKRDAVLPWKRTGYVYLKREGAQGSQWVSLGRQADPIMTANR